MKPTDTNNQPTEPKTAGSPAVTGSATNEEIIACYQDALRGLQSSLDIARKALDALAIALTEHHHQWTPEQRALYEDAMPGDNQTPPIDNKYVADGCEQFSVTPADETLRLRTALRSILVEANVTWDATKPPADIGKICQLADAALSQSDEHSGGTSAGVTGSHTTGEKH